MERGGTANDDRLVAIPIGCFGIPVKAATHSNDQPPHLLVDGVHPSKTTSNAHFHGITVEQCIIQPSISLVVTYVASYQLRGSKRKKGVKRMTVGTTAITQNSLRGGATTKTRWPACVR
jgi:hypothetical protein